MHVSERPLSQGRAEDPEQHIRDLQSSPVVVCNRTKMQGKPWGEEGQGKFRCEVIAKKPSMFTIFFGDLRVSGTRVFPNTCVHPRQHL